MHRATVVYIVRTVGVDVAQRIVGQRGEVNYGFELREVLRAHIANVEAPRGYFRHRRPERTVLVEKGVETFDLMARLPKQRH